MVTIQVSFTAIEWKVGVVVADSQSHTLRKIFFVNMLLSKILILKYFDLNKH